MDLGGSCAGVRPQRSYLDHLRDIQQAPGEAVEFIDDMDFPAFAADRRTNLAVVRALEVIGEATRHIPADARRRAAIRKRLGKTRSPCAANLSPNITALTWKSCGER